MASTNSNKGVNESLNKFTAGHALNDLGNTDTLDKIGRKILSDVTVYLKYAKYLPALKRRETRDEIITRNMAMHLKKFPHLAKEIRAAYQYVYDGKVLPSMRAMQFAGKPIEINNARIFNCLTRDTKFVTSEGVKSFEDFEDGDEVTVLTHKGNWKKAVVRNYGKDHVNEIRIKRGRHSHTVRATANHRWILKDGAETTALKVGDKLMAAPAVKDTNYGVRGITKAYNISTNLTSKTNMSFVVSEITPFGYEEVWCLEVEDDRSFVLATGVVTGNCSFLHIDHYAAFAETMFLLLSGCGVGYSVQRRHIDKLPEIRRPTRTRRYLISDSIEGWADAVKVLMKAYLRGSPSPVFDFSDIRPKGAMLVTSGGKAPGPEPLKDCLQKVQRILDRKENGSKLTPLEAHDILCYIADAVLAGGIRRSAMIALFDLDDEEMLTCKGNLPLSILPDTLVKNGTTVSFYVDYRGERISVVLPNEEYEKFATTGKLPWYYVAPARGRANNSVVLLRHRIDKKTFLDLWDIVKESEAGEPGIFFTNDADWGVNPCAR